MRDLGKVTHLFEGLENLTVSSFLSHPSEQRVSVSCLLLWKTSISKLVLYYSTEGTRLGSWAYKPL